MFKNFIAPPSRSCRYIWCFSTTLIHESNSTHHTMSAVTVMLNRAHQGDRQAAGQLLPLVYDELRRLASRK